VSIPAVDLNLVRVLHMVLLEQNVARAAERLHVTPSAVSNALARLREVLGDPLVTRKGRGIVPTARAKELAPLLERAMRDIEEAFVTMPFDAARCTRSFTLATADVGQIAWLPRISRAMGRELPRAHLRVVGIDALIALGDLSSPEIDLQIGIPPSGPDIHVEPLLDERSVLVARNGHPSARRKLSLSAMASLRHVRVDMVPTKRFRDAFESAFASTSVPREIVLTVPSFIAAAEVVAASDLVTMLPSSLLAAKGRSLGLRELTTPLPEHITKLAMVWHARTDSDPAARAFRGVVRRAVVPGKGRAPGG
jgi:DNA-binding transcriptional LysR family regulator